MYEIFQSSDLENVPVNPFSAQSNPETAYSNQILVLIVLGLIYSGDGVVPLLRSDSQITILALLLVFGMADSMRFRWNRILMRVHVAHHVFCLREAMDRCRNTLATPFWHLS
jgi:hypothetical protein